jgi:hypothetical protein
MRGAITAGGWRPQPSGKQCCGQTRFNDHRAFILVGVVEVPYENFVSRKAVKEHQITDAEQQKRLTARLVGGGLINVGFYLDSDQRVGITESMLRAPDSDLHAGATGRRQLTGMADAFAKNHERHHALAEAADLI